MSLRNKELQTPLHLAVLRLLNPVVDVEDIGTQNASGETALHVAVLSRYKMILEILLTAGADAAAIGHEAVVQLLLDKGADANAQGGPYVNALQAASAIGHEAVVQLLLDKGANANA